MAKDGLHFEVLDGFAADVLAIAAHGRITREDYEKVLIPEFEKTQAAEGKVKVLLICGDDFTGYSPGAVWDDARFGFLHMHDIAGLALVTDADWLRLGVKALAPLIACPVAVFHLSELEAAKGWINEWKHAGEGTPEVDVSGKLPTLEDKA